MLKPTATGLDLLPAWFLRMRALFFARPLVGMFNLSIATLFAPHQWKQANIRPIQKMLSPVQHLDFRLISITSGLSRIIDRTDVSHFLYPAFNAQPPPGISFANQFAFRPIGSTRAAIVAILHTVTYPLATNSYVIVISLDFSKAFDTVRHWTLMQKMAKLDVPDYLYNWLVDFFFNDRTHDKEYLGNKSDFVKITASIIQGSGVGPAAFVVKAAD